MSDSRPTNDSTRQIPRSATPAVTEPVPDLQLQMLIRLLGQDVRSWLPITLNVPGGVVHGDLISREAWKSDWAASLRQVGNLGSDLLAEFPGTVDEAVGELWGEDGPGHHPLPRWIHLRNATVAAGGAAGTVDLLLWRGRLADVAGWGLGRPE